MQAWWIAIPWLVLVGLAGFLMVSTWRFWSGKEIDLSRSHPFRLIFVMAIVLYVMIRFSQVVLFALALIYMFSGIWARAAYGWSRRRRRGQSAIFRVCRRARIPIRIRCITHKFKPQEGMPVYKIAIVGAATLLGKELKDALTESSLAAADDLRCYDEDEGLGQLDQIGDEVTFVQAITADAFEHVDFTFFCGTETLTRRHLARGAAGRVDGAGSFGRA